MLQLYSSKCPRLTWSKHRHAGRCGPRTGFVRPANAFCITYVAQSHKDIVLEQRFQNFLSATQIWICRKPRDPCLKQHMIKIIIVWMILSSMLLGLFSLSAIYSFIKFLHYRHWDRQSSGNGENIQPGYRSPWQPARPIFDPLRPTFRLPSILWEPLY